MTLRSEAPGATVTSNNGFLAGSLTPAVQPTPVVKGMPNCSNRYAPLAEDDASNDAQRAQADPQDSPKPQPTCLRADPPDLGGDWVTVDRKGRKSGNRARRNERHCRTDKGPVRVWPKGESGGQRYRNRKHGGAPIGASAAGKAGGQVTRTRGDVSESAKKPLSVPSEARALRAASNADGTANSSMPAGAQLASRLKDSANDCASNSKQWADVVANSIPKARGASNPIGASAVRKSDGQVHAPRGDVSHTAQKPIWPVGVRFRVRVDVCCPLICL